MSNENIPQYMSKRPPGTCIPWEEAKQRFGDIKGDEDMIRQIWEQNDAEAYDYFWQCLLSF